ncbi:TIGR03750 family conjugal transfer protein [Pseudomonas lopnurensis]|uniref:TIGR03750 family conjugal transfer protein n=1 Tax=Pseudomonas lopnurensis TaxID=1477517 RepID=UPI0028B1DAFF|nr:TIGR03750 family conjugal transfer protein [Pseudomonas lopnurensis]
MATIEFLPDRLNRPPIVFRGLTSAEMFLAFAVGASVGLALGIALAIALGYLAVAPSAMLLGGFFAVFFSGSWLANKKRGRSPMWLYRAIQMRLTLSSFGSIFHAFGLTDRRLVLRESHWSVRRNRN